MTSISPSDAASAVPAAPASQEDEAPGSDLHSALIALVRLLARQAVREWLAEPETAEAGAPDAPRPSPPVSRGERP